MVHGQSVSHCSVTPKQLVIGYQKILYPETSHVIEGDSFTFLNLSKRFEDKIDWDFEEHGKLWTYNLNYFDFLANDSLTRELRLSLMQQFATGYSHLQCGKEPYPTSLRCINWIRFLSIHHIKDKGLINVVYNDMLRLKRSLEWHLMGNHLLENVFALLWTSLYFHDQALYRKSEALLIEQLEEQVLGDGAHFELSPMYHKIVLSRLLGAIDLLVENPDFDSSALLKLMREKAASMLGWLLAMSFENGDLPHFNDSTEGIAPEGPVIQAQAKHLGINATPVQLKDSGYRKITRPQYQVVVDLGKVGPDHIPGHAHCDLLSFVLYHKQRPLLVDTGISTYEKNDLRQAQRSTAAHNTVMVDGEEQSEIWQGFRVARRARPNIISDSPEILVASHTGYKRTGPKHTRTFNFMDNGLQVEDHINKDRPAKAFLHFHPEVQFQLVENQVIGEFGSIQIEGAEDISLQKYDYATGFNQVQKAGKIVIKFRTNLKISIKL